ncbi:hypothetical protein [Legionella clemsonensis]|uniref:hypothetical protein n=1 Tax=Legionella clemsonensis TaxID=1867846 RepID=UPI000B8D0AA1|nr:hypothetical protein [Legionella clemsonensis]
MGQVDDQREQQLQLARLYFLAFLCSITACLLDRGIIAQEEEINYQGCARKSQLSNSSGVGNT